MGAPQVGKSTLAMRIMAERRGATERFDLEDPADLARLDDARLAFSPLRGLVVLDEVQRRPEFFPVLHQRAVQAAARAAPPFQRKRARRARPTSRIEQHV